MLILPSFSNFSILPSVTPIKYIRTFLFVKDFSAYTWLRILKFGTNLDSNELYCVKKTATYCLSVPLFVHFSFSPMKISVADFSAPIGANVFKFCKHLQVGKVYCVNENLDANAHFAFFFQFFLLSLLYNTYGHFPSELWQQLLDLGLWNFVYTFG